MSFVRSSRHRLPKTGQISTDDFTSTHAGIGEGRDDFDKAFILQSWGCNYRTVFCRRLSLPPFPIAYLWHVLTVLVDVLAVFDQLVRELLLQVDAAVAGLRQAVNRVHHKVEAIEVVQHRHIKRGGDRAFFLVAADVDVPVIGASVGEPVDQPRVGVKGEDDGFVPGEQLVEVPIAQTVRVFRIWLQPHKVNDVNDPDFEIGQMLVKDGNGGERFQRGDITAAGHHHVRIGALIVTRPLPDADTLCAVGNRSGHGQPLRRGMFPCNDHVDVMATPQAVIHHGEEAVRIRRQINPHHPSLFVDDMINEAGVLMRESIVILSPYV